MQDSAKERERMVKRQLRARGIDNPAVLRAMRAVPREKFVPQEMERYAYQDRALPIDERQTISQPYIVALMAQAADLQEGDRVLEIGTGSGYSAAVLGEIAGEVYTIERIAKLARQAQMRLESLGYENVHVRSANGTLGWPEEAPFDAILVTAGGPEVPATLKDQLALGGRLVIPVGRDPFAQQLTCVRRTGESAFRPQDLGPVRFVPLIGEQGWEEKGRA
jgi:protein-L-isoaspartate(D-aspartate) O-methyltransferase